MIVSAFFLHFLVYFLIIVSLLTYSSEREIVFKGSYKEDGDDRETSPQMAEETIQARQSKYHAEIHWVQVSSLSQYHAEIHWVQVSSQSQYHAEIHRVQVSSQSQYHAEIHRVQVSAVPVH